MAEERPTPQLPLPPLYRLNDATDAVDFQIPVGVELRFFADFKLLEISSFVGFYLEPPKDGRVKIRLMTPVGSVASDMLRTSVAEGMLNFWYGMFLVRR